MVDPFLATAETVRRTPLTSTTKSVVNAVVACSASLYVSVSKSPVAPTSADAKTGGVVSAVELLVTPDDATDTEIASLPAESCIALFDVALFVVGAV